MANNRLYLYCKKCNEYLMLSKHFGEPYAIGEEDVSDINLFFERHFWDCEGAVVLCEESPGPNRVFTGITDVELPGGAKNMREEIMNE